MKALALLACAACAGTVKPDDMSAESHRREADAERAAARDHDPDRERGEDRDEDGGDHPLHTKSRRWNSTHASASRPTIQPRPCRLAIAT